MSNARPISANNQHLAVVGERGVVDPLPCQGDVLIDVLISLVVVYDTDSLELAHLDRWLKDAERRLSAILVIEEFPLLDAELSSKLFLPPVGRVQRDVGVATIGQEFL